MTELSRVGKSTFTLCRGTQLQLEKNQRKVQRLKHQLELLKVSCFVRPFNLMSNACAGGKC